MKLFVVWAIAWRIREEIRDEAENSESYQHNDYSYSAFNFVAASFVMYGKFDSVMKTGVRNEAEYVKVGLEEAGTIYLNEKVGQATDTRITLTDKDGNVLYDSEADASLLPNHSDRPEFIQAMESGQGEIVRYSETLARQTFYYAVKLSDGRILRLAKTTDSVFHTLMTSFTLLGLLMILIILVEYVLAQQQTKSLIEPINNLNLEKPLDNVCYEELRPLLVGLISKISRLQASWKN